MYLVKSNVVYIRTKCVCTKFDYVYVHTRMYSCRQIIIIVLCFIVHYAKTHISYRTDKSWSSSFLMLHGVYCVQV